MDTKADKKTTLLYRASDLTKVLESGFLKTQEDLMLLLLERNTE